MRFSGYCLNALRSVFQVRRSEDGFAAVAPMPKLSNLKMMLRDAGAPIMRRNRLEFSNM
jgi:hypothetical protein